MSEKTQSREISHGADVRQQPLRALELFPFQYASRRWIVPEVLRTLEPGSSGESV
jgi:hypothetical protein